MNGHTPTSHGKRRVSGGLIAEIKNALEKKDLEAYASLFAEDAVLEEVSSRTPPAHPKIVRGREAIQKCLEEDLLRDPVSGWTRHVSSSEIFDAIETDEAIAFTEVRTYEAGDKVVAQHIAQKKNGRIEHDRLVIAWDEVA